MLSTPFGRVVPIPMLALVLVGCSGSSDTAGAGASATSTVTSSPAIGTASAGATATASAAPSATAGAPASHSADAGCAANHEVIPKGAGTASSPDLDHDGKRDTVWLADSGTTRRLGVRTASGATFSTTYTSAAPQAAAAIGQRLGDGSEIILLNTGRSVQLYAVIDCRIVVSHNAQGKQYSFDLGFTGFGTGVRCVDSGRGLQVAGMLAEPDPNSTFTVYQTRIALSGQGRQARNIARQTLAKKAAATSSLVKSAQTVSCGAGNPGANEPEG
jgi:hypothetical protein